MVLSGYVHEEGMQVRMSIRDQLRANIFARIQTNMRLLPESHQDDILTELAEENSKKETAKEFIAAYSVRDELVSEFIDSKLIELDEVD